MTVIETFILASAVLTFMYAWVYVLDFSPLIGAIVAIPVTFAVLAFAGPVAAVAGIVGAVWACWSIFEAFGPAGILTIIGLVGSVVAVITVGFIIVGLALLIVGAIAGVAIATYSLR